MNQENKVRALAKRHNLILHKSRVRTTGHPEHGKFWLMHADNYHPVHNYRGHAYLTLADVAEILGAWLACRVVEPLGAIR